MKVESAVDYSLRNFMNFSGDIKLEKIDTPLLGRFQKERLKKASLSTVNCELVYIIRLLRMNGFQIDKPFGKPGKVTFQRAFTDDEIKRFFCACPERLVPSKRSTHIALLKSEVDIQNKRIYLRTAKQRKSLVPYQPKPRIISVPDSVIRVLNVAMSRIEGEHVFPSMQNLPRDFNDIIEKAGILKFDKLGARVTAHSFRHTYSSKLAQMVGQNAFILKDALGHRKLSTTERYVHHTAPVLELKMGFE